MKISKELLESFQKAHALSFEDVKVLLAYYKGLQAALTPCPPEYQLTLNDVRSKVDRLQDMHEAHVEGRKRGKQWVAGYLAMTKPNMGSNITCSV